MANAPHFQAETHYQDTKIAGAYDSFRFSTRSGMRGDRKEKRSFMHLLDKAGPLETALDVPCGTGRMTEVLLQRGLSVTGCDISAEMIAEAEKKLSSYSARLAFLQGDIRSLGFDESSFDIVTCVRLFGHFPAETRIEILREMARVSRGPVIVQYFVATSLTRFKRFIKKRLLRVYPGVSYPATMQEVKQEIHAAGLKSRARSHCRWYYSEEVFFLLEKH